MDIYFVKSVFDPSITHTQSVEVLLDIAKNNAKVEEYISYLRSIDRVNKEKFYKSEKSKLTVISLAEFKNNYVSNENFIHSEFMPCDIDHLDPASIPSLRTQIESDPCVALCFLSPGAEGLKFWPRVEKINEEQDYKKKYRIIQGYFEKKYNIKLDNACCDPRRLTFVSHDPNIYYNPNAGAYKFPEKQVIQEPCTTQSNTQSNSFVTVIVNPEIREKALELVNYLKIPENNNYGKWISIVAAMKNCGFTFEEADQWCQTQPGYTLDGLGKVWKNLKRAESDNIATLGTLIYIARQNGYIPAWEPIQYSCVETALPPFPIDALPIVCAEMAQETSNVIKTKIEVAALAILAICGSAMGNKTFARIHSVITRSNTYKIVFQKRGERKSTLFNELIEPVNEWIAEMSETYNKSSYEHSLKKKKLQVLESELSKLQGAEEVDAEKVAAMEKKIYQLEEEVRKNLPVSPCYISNNATNSGIIEIMKNTGGIAAIFSDDGRDVIQIICGLYTGGETQESLYVKCYGGLQPESRGRSGNIITIHHPCLNLFVMVQPDKISKMAETETFRESGFISRIEFCYPESLVGKKDANGNLIRKFEDREISPKVKHTYSALVKKLLDSYYITNEIRYVPVHPDAKQEWIKFHDYFEWHSDEDGKFGDKLDFLVRLPEKALKYALIITLIEDEKEISLANMQKGIKLAEYYAAHATKIMDIIFNRTLPPECNKILRQIDKKFMDGFSLNDILQYANLDKDVAIDALKILTKKNFIRVMPAEPVEKRKPASPRYEVNPEYQMKKKQSAEFTDTFHNSTIFTNNTNMSSNGNSENGNNSNDDEPVPDISSEDIYKEVDIDAETQIIEGSNSDKPIDFASFANENLEDICKPRGMNLNNI